jgi:hypothetical protein
MSQSRYIQARQKSTISRIDPDQYLDYKVSIRIDPGSILSKLILVYIQGYILFINNQGF